MAELSLSSVMTNFEAYAFHHYQDPMLPSAPPLKKNYIPEGRQVNLQSVKSKLVILLAGNASTKDHPGSRLVELAACQTCSERMSLHLFSSLGVKGECVGQVFIYSLIH